MGSHQIVITHFSEYTRRLNTLNHILPYNLINKVGNKFCCFVLTVAIQVATETYCSPKEFVIVGEFILTDACKFYSIFVDALL